MLTGIWVFSMEILYISYGEFFKVTCTAVQELYRSSLVCPLIPIRRAAFWSKRLVCTVLGSMLTGIWVFSMEILYSYVNSSRSPVRPYKNCTGQVWYVHWFSSGELRFGPTAIRTVLGSLTGIWVFSMEILYISNGKFFKVTCPAVRPYKNCTGQVWYVHWFPSGELRFGPNG